MREKPWLREALLYEKREDDKVRCETCARFCTILPGKLGFCKTRKNLNGKLFTLEYGNISSISPNPIEKKPFFHFHPGSYALTVGSWSCNFTCPWCQNWDISKTHPEAEKPNFISPEELIELVEKCNCQGTSISFNEPTLMLEYSLDVFKLARKKGYYNTFVTNGYMSLKALELLAESGLNAMNIDVKGCEGSVKKYCKADVKHVWKVIKRAKELGVHVELTTLVIPTVNDSEKCLREIARKIAKLDDEIPWHITRYFPAYKFSLPPTPIQTLEKARRIGIEEGLKYVYLGNVPGHLFENTYCPNCGELLIERYVFDVVKIRLKDKKCPKCEEEIPIVGKIMHFS